MKGNHLSCTILPLHFSDFERFPWEVFNHLLMTTMPFGNQHPRPFHLGGTNLGGYLYHNHPALHVFMRTHSLMIYTPIGHDCFQGAGRRAKGTGVYVFFWEPESTMGYGKLIDFTASIAHSFCSCYHFHFLLLFHFVSFHFSL